MKTNFDLYDVTFKNGNVVRMIKSCLYNCYLNNACRPAKESVASYTKVLEA